MKTLFATAFLLFFISFGFSQCPVINTTTTTAVNCNGGADGTATANPTGGTAPYIYLWMPGSQTTQTATGLSSGITYTLTIDDATPCTQVVELITVSEPPPLVVNTSTTAVSCFGGNNGSATASASGGTAPYSYLWMSGSQTTQSITSLSAGNYSVQVTDSNSCAASANAVVSQPITPYGHINSSVTVCSGSNSGTLTLAAFSGTIVRWEYSSDGGITWLMISNTTATQQYSNLNLSTRYRAIIQPSGCPAGMSASATVTVRAASVGGTTSGAATICSGVNIGTVNVNGFTGNVSMWQSSTNAGASWVSIANTTSSLTYTNIDTTIVYRAIVQNSGCAADTSSLITITVNATPIAGFSVAPVCIGQSSVFVDTSSFAGGNIQYAMWNFDDSTSSTAFNAIHTYRYPDVFAVTLTVVSTAGCTAIATNYATVYDLPHATITAGGPLAFCMGGSVSLTAASVGLNYSWNNASTSQSITVNTSGMYSVTVTHTNTGCTNADSIRVKVFPLPMAYAGNDTAISLGFSFALNGKKGVSYLWSPGIGLNDTAIYNPVAAPLNTTLYILTVTDSNGCRNKDTLLITVLTDYLFTVSNALTPNNDGLNDVWNIQNLENYPDNSVTVFNRYGQEVYSAAPYKNDWSGTYNGNLLPDATYYYVLTFTGSQKIFKGAVSIINGSK